MELEGNIINPSEGRAGFALTVDTSRIVQKVGSAKEARALPPGTVIGDRHGGLTFTDSVAAVLETRSIGGWQELRDANQEVWTIIVLNR